ncbi:MAG: sigma-70 family RNA polymerase sigma factor, partial [Planctomycetes bacterium]|nr:sigma-70 family RNA polymerase sigma factor [Planctomycetota bacterium]
MKVSSELVREARGGDRAALERLIAATQDPLFHFLRREVGSEADAEDALQETWRQALRSLRDLREPAAFASWIHRIALRAGRDMAVARRARREAEAAGSRNESTEGGGTMEAERREVAGRVREAVEALEPELRTTVRLRYEQGLSYEEIAEAMECPSGTVGKRLHTAHERLRGSLAGAGVALALALLEGELEAAPREAAPAGVRERLREMARRGLPVPDAGAARGVTAGRLVAGVAGLLAIGAAFWGVAALRG